MVINQRAAGMLPMEAPMAEPMGAPV